MAGFLVTGDNPRCECVSNDDEDEDELCWMPVKSKPLRLFGSGGNPGNDILILEWIRELF